MTSLRVFVCFLRWDLLREIRRREAVLNMILFAVLILFIIDFSIGPVFDVFRNASDPFLGDLEGKIGPVFFWMTVLFAGTVGLSHAFAVEREGHSLEGIVLAPVDLGVFYLAKVVATWIYVMLMELCLLGAYILLFNFSDWPRLGPMIAVMGVFSIGYMAAGITLAAMTSVLKRGGEVVLRILLFPLLIPMVYLTLHTPAGTFGVDVTGGLLGRPIELAQYLALILAIDAIYLTAGYLIFPKILED